MAVKPRRIERIRGRELQEIRHGHFRNDPLCARCKEAGRVRLATELDHIVALMNGGEDVPSNRQGLCKPCHDLKTIEDLKLSHG
jgi:5-methylcytosine-specific restriction protein A